MSVDPTRLPYRPCVGAMILNESGNVWIGRRMDARRDAEGIGMWWQMPQGGIDEDEDPRAAAMREVYEETNISSVRIIAQTPGWLTYDLPPELVGVAWKGRYRGQKQRWFAMRFTGADDEIDIRNPGGGAFKPEFDEWRWAGIDELLDLIVPFKRDVYRQVIGTFQRLVP